MMAAHDNGAAKQARPYNPSVVARERAAEGLNPNGHRSDFHVPKSGRNPAAAAYVDVDVEPEHDGSGDIGHNGFAFAAPDDAPHLAKIKAIDWVLNSLVYNQTDALVMIGLIVRSDRTYNNAWPSTKTLAKYAKVSKDETIYQSIKKLESPPFGVIAKRDRGRGKSNVYSVLTSRVSELVALEFHEQQALKAIGKKPSGKGTPVERGPGQEDLFSAEGVPMNGTTAARGADERGPAERGSFRPYPPTVNGTPLEKAPPLNGTTVERDTPAQGGPILSKRDKLSTTVGKKEEFLVSSPHALRATGGQVEVEVFAPGRRAGSYSSAELDLMERKAFAAAGAILNPIAKGVGLKDLSPIQQWIEGGASLEHDILTTFHDVARKSPHLDVKTWRFFSNAVGEAIKRRKVDEARQSQMLTRMAAPVPLDAIDDAPVIDLDAGGDGLSWDEYNAVRVEGSFLAEITANYPTANPQLVCDTVIAQILRFRRGTRVNGNEIKALIRGECAKTHGGVVKARTWGKVATQDVSEAREGRDIDAARRSVFRKEGQP